MKQITIYDLLPLLKNGWVAMDKDGTWCWFSKKPNVGDMEWLWVGRVRFLDSFNIKRARKWKDSLIKVEHKEEDDV